MGGENVYFGGYRFCTSRVTAFPLIARAVGRSVVATYTRAWQWLKNRVEEQGDTLAVPLADTSPSWLLMLSCPSKCPCSSTPERQNSPAKQSEQTMTLSREHGIRLLLARRFSMVRLQLLERHALLLLPITNFGSRVNFATDED